MLRQERLPNSLYQIWLWFAKETEELLWDHVEWKGEFPRDRRFKRWGLPIDRVLSSVAYFFGIGPTYDASLNFSYMSPLSWPSRGNIRYDRLKTPMLFDISDGRQNRTDDHESPFGICIFE